MSATQMAPAPTVLESFSKGRSFTAPATTAPPNPFVGLVPLNEQNASLLAGRDEEIKILTTNLRAARLTLVYGGSGVGKSSLLRAGVVATLRELANEELNRFGSPSFAVAVISSWAGDPFEQVRISIREGLVEALQVESIPPLTPTTDLVETIRNCNNSCGVELFLILDQFEEFFLYHEGPSEPGTFAYEFSRAINATDIKARFLVSLRDDSLYKLDRFQSALPNLFENRLQVEPLTIKNAEQAIEKARSTYNASPGAITHVTIESGLVSAVLEQMKTDNLIRDGAATAAIPWGSTTNASNANYIDAPYMQLVMSRLWEEESKRWQKEKKPENTLKLDAFKALGTAQNVVQQHLDNIMQGFSFRDRKIASDSFSCLVTPGGSKYALTPLELEEWTGKPQTAIKNFLDKLADSKYRIVRRVNKKTTNGTEAAYEAHHDRLALAMRNWHVQYEREAAEERQRLVRLIVFGLIVIAIGGLITYQAVRLRKQEAAEIKKQEAAKLKELKVEENLEISSKAGESDRARLTALRTLVPKVICKETTPPADLQEINRVLGVECEPVDEAQLRPRIYIHIPEEEQRERANELRQWLRAQTFDKDRVMVPGIEYVGRRLLKKSELRYFHNDPYEVNFAWTVSKWLSQQKCVDVEPRIIKGYEASKTIRDRHFELWLTPESIANYGCALEYVAR